LQINIFSDVSCIYHEEYLIVCGAGGGQAFYQEDPFTGGKGGGGFGRMSVKIN